MLNATINNGSVAQLNRALDYGSRGYRFESCRNHKRNTHLECSFFCVLRFMMLTNRLWKVINCVSVDVSFLSISVMSRFFVVPLFAADRCASGGHAAHFLYSKTMLMPTSRHENKVFLSIFALWLLCTTVVRCLYALVVKAVEAREKVYQ